VLANGKGVHREVKSEGSHQQSWRFDEKKSDTRLNSGGGASNGLRISQNSTVTANSKSGRTQRK